VAEAAGAGAPRVLAENFFFVLFRVLSWLILYKDLISQLEVTT
jgi:hypothetical protein